MDRLHSKRRSSVMDQMRRWWKRYTSPYVDIRDDKLSKLPRLTPVWDETRTTRNDESDVAGSVCSQAESMTIFDTNSIQGSDASPFRRVDTPPLGSEPHAIDQPQHYEIDFDYYERQSCTCGSLESIDSLAESYWDIDDTVEVSSSQLTPIVTNIRSKMHQEFFAEHVRFLRIQTKPRKVEIIWGPENGKKPTD